MKKRSKKKEQTKDEHFFSSNSWKKKGSEFLLGFIAGIFLISIIAIIF